jgi:hypothetical protein
MRAFVRASIGILTVMVGTVVPGSAHAGPYQGAVDADISGVQYEWDDEGEVSRYSHSVSGATGLWQAVLWADGATESNGTPYDEGDIDCQFGPNTEYTTRSWQAMMGNLAVDGRAGNHTWTVAGDHLVNLASFGDGAWVVRYQGRVHSFTMLATRITPGSPTSGWYWTNSWNGAWFTYDSKPAGCAGVPNY